MQPPPPPEPICHLISDVLNQKDWQSEEEEEGCPSPRFTASSVDADVMGGKNVSNVLKEKLIWAIFRTQPFGFRTPPPPPLFLMHPCL